jgi:1-acyl-sn-glycerol-3-phosphate acyltransferase
MQTRSRVVWALTPPLIRAVARVAWRLDVVGRQLLPDPPYVLASNHHSFLDPLLLGAVHRRPIRFVGLSDLWGHYRTVDFFLDAWQVIPVTRGRVPLGAMREALRHLESGGTIGIFPEGRRYDVFDPRHALPGAAWLAARAGVPLVPAAVRGSEKVLGVDNRLHRGRISIAFGAPIHAHGCDRPSVDHMTVHWGSSVESLLGNEDTRPSDSVQEGR